jgi:hypothetical protein
MNSGSGLVMNEVKLFSTEKSVRKLDFFDTVKIACLPSRQIII